MLAFLVSIGTIAGLLTLGASAGDAQADEAEEVAEVTDGELTIELGSEPVFAYVKSTVTVTEDMPAGYTLKAYSENSTLSAEGTDKTISMVTIPEDGLENAGSLATSLMDNTWGLAVEEPESEASEVFYSLPENADDAVVIKSIDDYSKTEAGDKTTVYYGVYITPDMPYGEYTGAVVSYVVEEPPVAVVTYNGNGLYFNGDERQDTNMVVYNKGASAATEMVSHTPNVNNAGEQSGMYPINTAETFVYDFANASKVNVEIVKSGNDSCSYAGGVDTDAYFSFWSGSHPDYTAEAKYSDAYKAFGNTTGKYVFGDYNNAETDIENTSSVTFAYHVGSGGSSRGCGDGYGYYAVITATDAEGQPAHAIGNAEVKGEYETPSTTAVEGYTFLGWSTDPNATSATYTSASDIAVNLPLDEGEKVTLYAIWSPAAFTINYDGNGNTAGGMVSDSVTLSHLDVVLGTAVNLYAPNYKKDGYGFAGWSIDADAWTHLTDDDATNDPTIYGPNQTISPNMAMAKSTLETKSATLYAVWVPAEKNNGTPVTLQGWTGCGGLDASSYDAETGKFSVGANTLTALTDSRDGEVYTVAKLADGNCWTVENLRLDNSTTHESTTLALSQDNTNNPSLPLKNNYSTSATSNRLSVSSNSWCTDYDQKSCYDQSIINTNNTNLGGAGLAASYNANNDSSQWYSYGNNYNWYSATAGRGTRSVESGTVAGDICPTGWHLPYGGDSTDEKGGNTSGGFYYLNQQMSKGTSATDSNNWRSFPNNFVYSGSWNGSSAGDRGVYGNYWSSTANNNGNACYLALSSGRVGPDGNGSKYNGNSVRCVAPVQ